ncbi:MAG: type IV secretory system conjugative DNA transfer family protein [Pseudomonadota bacterium]
MRYHRQGEHPTGMLILGVLFSWFAWKTFDLLETEWALMPLMFMFSAGLLFAHLGALILRSIPRIFFYIKAMKTTGKAGTAGWASPKEIQQAGLFKTFGLLSGARKKPRGFLAGLHNNKPVFVDIESSGLVLSPAGGGKTTGFVIPTLCHNSTSMLVPDLKGTLAVMTGKYRRKKFQHETLFVNPAGINAHILGVGARYNPLQILIDTWVDPKLHNQVLSEAEGLAKQFCQDPKTQGENQYWRNGARKFLIFAFVYLMTMEGNATLSNALSLLSDSERLHAALREAVQSTHLHGDLARLARDMIGKIENGDPKQVESFREGAVQSVEVFSASGVLAECTSVCDFRFSDMKHKKITIYLIADPTRMSVYAPWLAVLSWCALRELMRTTGPNRVCFLCDEITNFKVDNLPSMLTLAREYQITMWLIIQELEQWAYVYGRESLETLLSQTEVKIIMNIRSFKTCQLISNMLGDQSIKSKNYNIGEYFFNPVSTSVHETPRKLMTPDEVRRTDKIILFSGGLRPVLLDKISYHEISPWKKQLEVNPLYGKAYKGKTKLRL